MRHELSDLDYRIKLLKGTTDHIQRGIGVSTLSSPVISGLKSKETVGVALLAFLIGGALVGSFAWHASDSDQAGASRLLRKFPINQPLAKAYGNQPLALSSAGDQLVFSGNDHRLYLWSFGELDPVPIRGAEPPEGQKGPGSFALAPDNEWLVFASQYDLSLKIVRLDGGTPITLATTTKDVSMAIRGIAWGSHGTIAYTLFQSPGLMEVPAIGGEPTQLTVPEEGEFHWMPSFLPNEEGVLFEIRGGPRFDKPQIAIQSDGSHPKVIIQGSVPRLTANEYLLFTRDNVVWAVSFDTAKGEPVGQAVPVIDDVASFAGRPSSLYSVSKEGTLIYWRQEDHTKKELAWVDRTGRIERLNTGLDDYRYAQVSPDGSRIAASVGDGDDSYLSVYSISKNRKRRLTFSDRSVRWLLWSSDGQRIVFPMQESDGEPSAMFWKSADGAGEITALTTIEGIPAKGIQTPVSWSGDGKTLLLDQCHPTGCNIMRMNMDANRKPEILMEDSHSPAISPNGSWMAYVSDEKVMVRPYPDLYSNVWQVADGVRSGPQWSTDGRELFFSVEQGLVSVPIDGGSAFGHGAPKHLFDYDDRYTSSVNYDLAPDGRFLTIRSSTRGEVVIVENWFDELERLVPTK